MGDKSDRVSYFRQMHFSIISITNETQINNNSSSHFHTQKNNNNNEKRGIYSINEIYRCSSFLSSFFDLCIQMMNFCYYFFILLSHFHDIIDFFRQLFNFIYDII
jgi:hypothetical protein